MMSHLDTVRRGAPRSAAVLAVLAALAAGPPAAADSLTDARIVLDARSPGVVELRTDVAWVPDAERREARVLLASELELTAATLDKAAAEIHAEDLAGTGLRAWTLRLPAPVAAGEKRMLSLSSTVSGKNGRGIRIDDASGFLLPGSGWFPRLEAEAEIRTAHAVTFLLPDGVAGVAAGEARGAADWQSSRCRPYAVWGPLGSEPQQGAAGEAIVSFERWTRKGGASGPSAEMLAGAVASFDGAFGTPSGSGTWKLIDVGGGVLAGGARTVFYDRDAWKSAEGDAAVLRDRDLFGAVAASYWAETLAFRGPQAAFLAHGITRYLGDVTYQSTLDHGSSEDMLVTRARRAAFLEGIGSDRALEGLAACAPDAEFVLATRAALVAHQMAATVTSERPRWILELTRFRRRTGDAPATAEDFRTLLRRNVVEEVGPYLTTTELPDLALTFQGPREARRLGVRFGVDVENRGSLATHCNVAVYDGRDRELHRARLSLAPGQMRSLNFPDPTRIARVVVDPEGLVLQPDISGEDVAAEDYQIDEKSLNAYVPSFGFRVAEGGPRAVRDFHLELDGATITGFNGYVVPYTTKHGPSGACLVGSGKLRLEPTKRFAEAWTASMGRPAMNIENAREMWLRFPLDAWEQIEPQLGAPVPDDERQEVTRIYTWIYQFAFPTYFFERSQAQVPPPGSTVIVYTGDDNERRGYARVPYPDASVEMRFWELRGNTLWEERR